MIEFSVLGGVRLSGGDPSRLAGLVAQPKRVALLAYLTLASPRGAQSRDTLLALFWPDLDTRHARWSLNQAVRHLRRALGPTVVLRRRNDVAIDPDRLHCDATALESACAAGRWEEAHRLYGGDLLAGLAPGGAAALEHWLDAERSRLRRLVADAASTRSQALLAAGDVQGAAAVAREALRLAPDDETRVRRVIELLSAAGDRAGAVRAYEDYAAWLGSALELQPAPQTTALVEALRDAKARKPLVPRFVPPLALRSPERRPRIPLLVGVASILLALPLAVESGNGGHPRTLRPDVVVQSFENLTGKKAFDPIGRAVSQSIVDGLAQLGTLEVDPVGKSRSNPSFRVSGSYRERGDSIEFVTEIADLVHGRVLPSPEPCRAPLRDPLASVETVRGRAAGALAYYTGIFGSPGIPERRPPSYPAYLAFNEGLRHMFRMEPESSEAAFRRATALDPTYTEAYQLLGGFVFWNEPGRALRRGGDPGRFGAMDSLARVMRQVIAQPTDADRFVLAALEARARGDLNAGLSAYLRLAEWIPSAAFGAGYHAMSVNRPDIAVDQLRSLDLAWGWMREWPPYWAILAGAFHEMGDFEQERRTAQDAIDRFPGLPGFKEEWLRASIALGQVDGVQMAAAGLEGFSALRLAMEARAHGYPALAGRLLTLSLNQLRPDRSGPGRYGVAMALSLLGRQSDAARILEELTARDTLRLDFKGLLGMVYAREGARAAAMRIARELASVRETGLQGLPTLWRARIAALLDDRATAVRLLRQAYAEGTKYAPWFLPGGSFWHSDPAFVSLHDYPPYQALVRPR